MDTPFNNTFSLAALVRDHLPHGFDIDTAYKRFSASIAQEIAQIAQLRDSGQPVIPEVSFGELCEQGFTNEQAALVRKRGCVVVRGTFAQGQVRQWNESLHDYLDTNHYFKELQKAIEANDEARAEHPHMLDIYWSKSQLEIRQSKHLHTLQKLLNGLWHVDESAQGSFNPAHSFTYADRVRIREPGDQVHGLAPHVDNCSMESWFSGDTIATTYGELLGDDWQSFNAFDATRRVSTNQKPHKDSCGVFRSYQGWMALTPQGAGCGSLQLVPSSRCVAWMFLNMLHSSMSNDDQVFPLPSEAYLLHPEKHDLLIRGLCSLPMLRAGDTVWWHPDAVHAVEHCNQSKVPSSVVYLGIAPDCERNRQYMLEQFKCFEEGLSPPDFPASHVEQHYRGRATRRELTELGAAQMGGQTQLKVSEIELA